MERVCFDRCTAVLSRKVEAESFLWRCGDTVGPCEADSVVKDRSNAMLWIAARLGDEALRDDDGRSNKRQLCTFD